MILFLSSKRGKAHNLDFRTAARDVIQDLITYRQLGTLQNAIKHLNQQLSVINVFNEQQKQAIATFIGLQNAGIGTEKEIRDLIVLVNTWNKHWQGMTQGSSNGNGDRSKLDDKLIGH